MKIHFDKKLLKYSIYVTLTAIAIYLALTIMSNVGKIFTTTFNIIGAGLSLIKPLLIAIVIAYLLYPLTKFIENFLKTNNLYQIKNKSTRRVIAIVLSYVSIIGIVLSLLWGIYFMIGGQLSKNTTITNIISDISSYLSTNSFSTSTIENTLKNLNIPFIDTLQPYIIQIVATLQKYIMINFGAMTSNIMSIGSSIASFFVAIIISIYILKDSEYFIRLWKKLYYLIFRESRVGNKIEEIFRLVHDVFSKFIRGQLLEAFFVGALSAIALSLVGIDYAIVIGLIAGICNMIPYVGPLVGTLLAAIMGLLSGRPIKVIYAIIAMLVVQQIDNNLLAPKIVGNSVGLHAVFTMMAIIIGGNVGGLLGMLLAVPVAASIRVLFNKWYEEYTNSNLTEN
ncbi:MULTISPECIES: AI-2E family transporter [unclassified Clostridium]|uniref:AI-2E family transporter n=1 Tax=unclassified Clostridium TaxID=2614128 RepID=UPI001896D6F4|nr:MULTISPECIES: AI-2E family transporter [unclassified Clostridium]MBP3916880.1 AI-2E family transporter [Clostridium sp.]MEE0931971.1 AI-2E family transporter [Clostridium sp.]